MQYGTLHTNNTAWIFSQKQNIHVSDERSQNRLVQQHSNTTATQGNNMRQTRHKYRICNEMFS